MLLLYFPVSILLLAVFVAMNLVLMPFAYCTAILNKIQIIKRFSHLERKPQALIADLIAFIVVGWIYLSFAQLKDAVRFYQDLFLIRCKE